MPAGSAQVSRRDTSTTSGGRSQLHEPRDAARDDQLGHADHRPARPRARRSAPACSQLVWVILAYMIASTVLVLTAGRLSDLFGRKKAYVGGFVALHRSPRSARASPADGTELILWRILQGVGGAFLFANAAALVTDAFPREQLGLAMGTNTMVAAVGLVIGPVLGGALVAISWHWVFWFNVPLGARRRALGRRWSCTSSSTPRHRARARPARHRHLRRRPHRPRLRHLAGRPLRLGRPARDRLAWSPRPCCCRSSS